MFLQTVIAAREVFIREPVRNDVYCKSVQEILKSSHGIIRTASIDNVIDMKLVLFRLMASFT